MVMEEGLRVELLGPKLLGVLIASCITALPYLAGWLSNVSSGIISQWLRHKGYVSHMTAYRIFNGIELTLRLFRANPRETLRTTRLPRTQKVFDASYITALPYLASWLSNVSSGIISQWLRHKGYVSHMTAYRIFNGIAALGPAVSLIIITQLGCDSVSIIILFTITLLFNGCYFGGSKLGVLDLGVNFAGTMSGISGTITGITSIIAPTIVGAVTNNHHESKFQYVPTNIGHTVWFLKIKNGLSRFVKFWKKETGNTYY
uniref:Uncharacterized protein n=1 Tax=Timema poppense TaxID=170557 RepID=A0A7R9D8T3_TIMPO|nr:unnamed protein product [Timema poppensis]